jgi:hypothetical protein
MQSSVNDLLARPFDPMKNFFTELLALVICTRRTQLYDRQSPNQIRILGDGNFGNMEVLQGPGSLHPIVDVIGNCLIAEKIVLDPHTYLRHNHQS